MAVVNSSHCGRQLLRSTNPSSTSCVSSSTRVVCFDRASTRSVGCGLNVGTDKKKRWVSAKASVSASESVGEEVVGTGLEDLVASVKNFLRWVRLVRIDSLRLRAELLIERVIINCRFFTFIGVAGSLIGSILCFVEGCFAILESIYQYTRAMLKKTDHGEIMQLIIEAIDLFLVGTAMLVFGMGLYVLFIAPKEIKTLSKPLGVFHVKEFSTRLNTKSLSHAKSKLGHAVMMILKAGVLEKFKNVNIASALDLACFAGSILVLSASLLLLSRLHHKDHDEGEAPVLAQLKSFI
ncbi:hypothetical protein QJS04_geneDACA006580 [Acorus gramineus]|uniref:Uncharacterized protein n=1 Tax=Acorus gramineus TaxID=55184 RepID=A0AAV9B092_ACOGR|nr:hypothetical protein QJS04_geneDACA006580 [Acorus gramineus]